jgi:hypothetical protein
VTTWRHFARKTFPRVVRELGLPAAETCPGLHRCPLHDEPLELVTHTCERCYREAWDEVGRRYANAEQGAGRSSTKRRTA